jgi:nifR3 family TIM-barrel protein
MAPNFSELLREFPVVLAPMEDVSDAVYRRLCRTVGASLCVTEFVHATHMVARTRLSKRKALLLPDDSPTAIQIYGPDPAMLMQAAEIAAEAAPAFIDINCGCWVPRVARKGAGAAWLRDPAAMVEMAGRVVSAVGLPVTVKTRIGLGPESHMPIIDLARRLEDVGVAALTIHCRTAHMGHIGAADWSWARRAREVVSIPVVVNGDVRTADDVTRALAETGCAGVMIGRGAIDHPWVFREARARLAGASVPPPTDNERVALYRAILTANVEYRGERAGVPVTRRHLALLGDRAATVRVPLFAATTVAEVDAALDLPRAA